MEQTRKETLEEVLKQIKELETENFTAYEVLEKIKGRIKDANIITIMELEKRIESIFDKEKWRPLWKVTDEELFYSKMFNETLDKIKDNVIQEIKRELGKV